MAELAELAELRNFIESNKEELEIIYNADIKKISTSAELKILESKSFFPFWDSRINKTLHFLICFPEDCLDTISPTKVTDALDGHITEALKSDCIIHVNNNFEITQSKSETITNELIVQSSIIDRQIAIFFSPEGIDFGLRGQIIKNINFFYNELDRDKYLKLYHISSLQECLKVYEDDINQPGLNEAFFESSATLEHEKGRPKNLLVNSPENTMRNNLLEFLNRMTQHNFTKEIELSSQRELDLYTEVDGKQYLIEVKWMGTSVNRNHDGISSTNYSDADMRDGVIQTLEYIQELIEKLKFSLQCGFLCIFDARDDKQDIDYQDFKFVAEKPDLVPFYEQHFIKLDELKLDKV